MSLAILIDRNDGAGPFSSRYSTRLSWLGRAGAFSPHLGVKASRFSRRNRDVHHPPNGSWSNGQNIGFIRAIDIHPTEPATSVALALKQFTESGSRLLLERHMLRASKRSHGIGNDGTPSRDKILDRLSSPCHGWFGQVHISLSVPSAKLIVDTIAAQAFDAQGLEKVRIDFWHTTPT